VVVRDRCVNLPAAAARSQAVPPEPRRPARSVKPEKPLLTLFDRAKGYDERAVNWGLFVVRALMSRFLVLVTFLFVLSAATPAKAYDALWYKSDGWSGEYPYGFTMAKDITILIRETLDPDAPKTISCDLKRGATYHQWNSNRVKSDQLEFVSLTRIKTYEVKSDFRDELTRKSDGSTISMTFKKGDRWFFLKYLGEGAFVLKFKNDVYVNGGGLFGKSTEISPTNGDQDTYNEWLKLKCANSIVGWIFVKDIKSVPGFAEANIPEYGEASDQSESVWKIAQWLTRRNRRPPRATWIMASETSMRCS